MLIRLINNPSRLIDWLSMLTERKHVYSYRQHSLYISHATQHMRWAQGEVGMFNGHLTHVYWQVINFHRLTSIILIYHWLVITACKWWKDAIGVWSDLIAAQHPAASPPEKRAVCSALCCGGAVPSADPSSVRPEQRRGWALGTRRQRNDAFHR